MDQKSSLRQALFYFSRLIYIYRHKIEEYRGVYLYFASIARRDYEKELI